MRIAVVYESMFGNTRQVAEAVARGLQDADATADVNLVRASKAEPTLASTVDLLVAGGPTHAWSMSKASTRHGAVEKAAKPDSGLTIEPDAENSGLREWLNETREVGRVAAFDTRQVGPVALTGRASRSISRALRKAGAQRIVSAESFLVTKEGRLVDGEITRAESWGRGLLEHA